MCNDASNCWRIFGHRILALKDEAFFYTQYYLSTSVILSFGTFKELKLGTHTSMWLKCSIPAVQLFNSSTLDHISKCQDVLAAEWKENGRIVFERTFIEGQMAIGYIKNSALSNTYCNYCVRLWRIHY